jgi:Mce-associated membrane protein
VPAGAAGGSAAGDPEPARRLTGDPLVRLALVVTVIAALAAAWSGYSYRSASGDDSLAFAAERDRVLAAADQAIVNLNTLDHRHVDAGLKVWQDSATAQLYDEIVQGRARLRAEVEKSRTTSTATILESGLTELDARAGKAAVIAAVRVTITGADGKPAANIRRFAGQLTKTSAGWKLSALGQAPTGTS